VLIQGDRFFFEHVNAASRVLINLVIESRSVDLKVGFCMSNLNIVKKIMLSLVLLLLMPYAVSEPLGSTEGGEQPNNCVYLSIMISNKTNSACELVDKQVIYGRMSSSTQIPVLIPPKSSAATFEMRQMIYGPDIILTYECGEGHTITFESQQDLCIMNPGVINAKILSKSNISGKYTADRGSYIWNRHGSINWTLTP